MKTIKDTLIERRSIRRYEREPIDQQKLDFVYEAIRNTPTSYNGQQFSVIAITDQQIKDELYEITQQKQVKTSAIFMVFCLDYHKLKVAAELKNVDAPHFESTIDGYTVGVIDASLAMMSAVVAAEAQGLATCCVGYARTANPIKISEILHLPKGVSIVCGLAIGVPREMPDPKPKLPTPVVIHQNNYMSDNKLAPILAEYDATITHYNTTRSGDQTNNDWAGHIAGYHRHSMEHGIKEYLQIQLGLKL